MKKKNNLIKFVVVYLLMLITICGGIMLNHNTTNCVVQASDNSKAMCVIEKDSKRVLLAKNENERLANASTTKIVTFLTVLTNLTKKEKLMIEPLVLEELLYI